MKKDELRIKIKKDIDAYLAKGGVIRKIPRGHSTANPSMSQRKSRSIMLQKKFNDTLFTDNNNDSSNT